MTLEKMIEEYEFGSGIIHSSDTVRIAKLFAEQECKRAVLNELEEEGLSFISEELYEDRLIALQDRIKDLVLLKNKE